MVKNGLVMQPQIYIGEKNNRIKGICMEYNWAQQEVDGWIQQFKIAYFQPHEIITQMTEELGELSKAILEEDQNAIGEELADVTFALICMTNSHNITLKEKYDSPKDIVKSKSFLYLTNTLGQVAREISHMYGPKKKKATEEEANLTERLEKAFVTVNSVAKANNINLQAMFTEHMNKLYGRDNNRYERKDSV